MGYGAGVNLVFFGASALVWLLTKDSSLSATSSGTLVATGFGVLAVLFYLRHEYRRSEPREPIGSYLITAAVVCLFALTLNHWASTGVADEKQRAADAAGVVTATLTGSTTGVATYLGSWAAHQKLSIESYEYNQTTAIVTLTPDSSRPDLDVVITLADETTVLCESDKRVNWKKTAAGITFKAYCDTFIAKVDLESLRSVHISESHGAGRMNNSETNPSFDAGAS